MPHISALVESLTVEFSLNSSYTFTNADVYRLLWVASYFKCFSSAFATVRNTKIMFYIQNQQMVVLRTIAKPCSIVLFWFLQCKALLCEQLILVDVQRYSICPWSQSSPHVLPPRNHKMNFLCNLVSVWIVYHFA